MVLAAADGQDSNVLDLFILKIGLCLPIHERESDNVRLIYLLPHEVRKRGVKHAVAVEVISSHTPHSVKMKEQQWIPLFNQHGTVAPFHAKIGEIPWRQIGAEMLDDVDMGKQSRQPIKIALVSEAVALDEIVAPFDTAFAPPAYRGNPLVAVPDTHPPDVVDAEPLHVGQAFCEMVGD